MKENFLKLVLSFWVIAFTNLANAGLVSLSVNSFGYSSVTKSPMSLSFSYDTSAPPEYRFPEYFGSRYAWFNLSSVSLRGGGKVYDIDDFETSSATLTILETLENETIFHFHAAGSSEGDRFFLDFKVRYYSWLGSHGASLPNGREIFDVFRSGTSFSETGWGYYSDDGYVDSAYGIGWDQSTVMVFSEDYVVPEPSTLWLLNFGIVILLSCKNTTKENLPKALRNWREGRRPRPGRYLLTRRR